MQSKNPRVFLLEVQAVYFTILRSILFIESGECEAANIKHNSKNALCIKNNKKKKCEKCIMVCTKNAHVNLCEKSSTKKEEKKDDLELPSNLLLIRCGSYHQWCKMDQSPLTMNSPQHNTYSYIASYISLEDTSGVCLLLHWQHCTGCQANSLL